MWAKTLAGTERSDMPRYLVQSDFGPFPFQSGRIMAMFQSVGMTQYFQMRVKRGSSQLMIGAPPYFRSSAVMPQIPGARVVFSFRIAADISSAVGGVESIEGYGVALELELETVIQINLFRYQHASTRMHTLSIQES